MIQYKSPPHTLSNLATWQCLKTLCHMAVFQDTLPRSSVSKHFATWQCFKTLCHIAVFQNTLPHGSVPRHFATWQCSKTLCHMAVFRDILPHGSVSEIKKKHAISLFWCSWTLELRSGNGDLSFELHTVPLLIHNLNAHYLLSLINVCEKINKNSFSCQSSFEAIYASLL